MPYKLLRAPQPTIGTATPYTGRTQALVFQVSGGGYRLRPAAEFIGPPAAFRNAWRLPGGAVSAHMEPVGAQMQRVSAHLERLHGLSGYYTVAL
jgi:hypothetical protein